MAWRRTIAALAAALMLAPAALEAQTRRGEEERRTAGVHRLLEAANDREEADQRIRGRSRTGESGLVGLAPLEGGVEIGLGRFGIAEPPRRRTHMESERDPTSVAGRERGMAGVGLRLRF